MANVSQKFGRAGSMKGLDQPKAAPALLSQRSIKIVKNPELDASETFPKELPELSTDSACYHCKESPASGDSNCHICGHTVCARCAKPMQLSDRFPRKKDESLLRVCFGCKELLTRKGKPLEGKKEFAPPVWEVQENPQCFQCQAKGKQSNCYTCGQLFCSSCVTKRTDVPEYFAKQAKANGVRVCDCCRFAIVGGATFTDNHHKVREGIESANIGNTACLPLELVLRVPQYSSALREFLIANRALENVNFLAAVEIFRNMGKQDPSVLLPLSQQIHQEFLIPTANQLVNINAPTRDAIEKAVVSEQVKVGLFDAAVTAVTAMVEKDVYRRFAQTQESKNLLRESDEVTYKNYLATRNRHMSFSILQRKEDHSFLEAIMAALAFQKMLKTVRKGLAWYNDGIEGSHLLAYLHKEKYANSRPEALAIAQRLVEGGYLCHTLDPSLEFSDADVPANVYQAVDGVALAKKFPAIPSVVKVKENVFGYLLQRGVLYCRLWAAVSIEHMKLFLWRKEDGAQAHSALNLKSASIVFETGGEEDEDDGGGFSGGVKDSLGSKDAALRHGQVYLRISAPRDKAVLAAIPDASPVSEVVFLLEEPSLRSRWKRCFEKECKLPVKMVYTAGVSKRAALVVVGPEAAPKKKGAGDSFSAPLSPKGSPQPSVSAATDSFSKTLSISPVRSPAHGPRVIPLNPDRKSVV